MHYIQFYAKVFETSNLILNVFRQYLGKQTFKVVSKLKEENLGYKR